MRVRQQRAELHFCTCTLLWHVCCAVMRPLVIYHYPCVDGAFSALAACLHFRSTKTPARFVPLTVYKDHKPDELELKVGVIKRP